MICKHVRHLPLSIAVGMLCAVLLTLIRGGWRDAPYVIPVFAAVGFTITYGIASIIGSQRLTAAEAAISQHRGLRLLRDGAALLLVGSSLFWAGHLIQQAGFSGWLVAIALGVIFPLLVCLLATKLTIVFGLLAATSLAVSTLLHHPNFRQEPFARETWDRFLQYDLGGWVVIWCILAGLSLSVSVPLTIRRRRVMDARGSMR